jgi:hypothetical protein
MYKYLLTLHLVFILDIIQALLLVWSLVDDIGKLL